MSTSRRQREFLAELGKVTPALRARSGGRCEARIRGVCGGAAIHRHHRRPSRVRRDGKANRLSNLLHLCYFCHSYIHLHQPWSREHGYLLSTESDPDQAEGVAAGLAPGH